MLIIYMGICVYIHIYTDIDRDTYIHTHTQTSRRVRRSERAQNDSYDTRPRSDRGFSGDPGFFSMRESA